MTFTTNVRLPDETAETLSRLAEAEGRSKNDIIVIALTEMGERRSRSVRTQAAFDRILERDAVALDLLSR